MGTDNVVFNRHEIIRVVVDFVVAVACASIPFLIVKVAYPSFLLSEDGPSRAYFDISDYVINDFSFIGIALFVSYFFIGLRLRRRG